MDPPIAVQGYICVSTDPRRAGTSKGGETFIITRDEVEMLVHDQCQTEDQKVWSTTAQTDFPTAPDEGELKSIQDVQLGRPTSRHLHPGTSVFILKLQDETSTQNRSPSTEEIRSMELEKEWDTQDTHTDDPDQDTEPKEDMVW